MYIIFVLDLRPDTRWRGIQTYVRGSEGASVYRLSKAGSYLYPKLKRVIQGGIDYLCTKNKNGVSLVVV